MIVMGASLGGLKAVQTLLSGLPPSFPLPIVLALHRHKEGDDLLRHSLQRHTALRVIEVMDKEPIQPAHVYLGPPDYHLLVEQDCFSLSAYEPVQFARPSIDVLFESAADIMGSRLTAVVLTGSGQDGARGAAAIERRGGAIVVQEPATAQCPMMPAAALAATGTARVLPLNQMAQWLTQRSDLMTPRNP